MKFDKDCAIVVIRDLAAAILADLKLNSPVVTGNLRDRGVDFQTG
ncbi:hypothetical protein [Acetomicrobium sp.]|nr:hypothetical protein [Acetomicrobium sp.]